MEDSTSTGQRVAALLLESGCVSMRGEEPFRLPSGWASPVYMDCRRIIAFPEVRSKIVQACTETLRGSGIASGIDGIVAGEASGIALGAWIAEQLNLPLHYVRKAARGGRQVEGALACGQKALLVDDMMAAGTSKINFLRATRASGAVVEDLLVIFDYATFGADRSLMQLGVRTHALCTWEDIFQAAKARDMYDAHSLSELAKFISKPAEWSHQHGGLGA